MDRYISDADRCRVTYLLGRVEALAGALCSGAEGGNLVEQLARDAIELRKLLLPCLQPALPLDPRD